MKTKLVVCDLDNTLYDWVGYFVPSFYAMVDIVVQMTGCDRELLLDDFREVHRKYHDSEHPFSLLETRTIRDYYPNKSRQELAEILDTAFHAFNFSRKETLKLYDGVLETLREFKSRKIKMVAHTEGKLYSVIDRLRRLGLTDFFSHIYCRERSNTEHVNPESGRNFLKDFPMDLVKELSNHQRKPDPMVLTEICKKEGVLLSETIYIGDSISRDIAMARHAGSRSAWAKYGVRNSKEQYAALVRVTHWSDEDIARESQLRLASSSVRPDYTLEKSFSQILEFIN